MIRFATLAVLVGALSFTAVSTSLGRPWQEGIEGSLGVMPYRYYLPAGYDDSIDYPLVLFLHGSGESGYDNDRQVRVHIGGLIDKTESEYPAILVAPQLVLPRGWGPNQPYAIDQTPGILAHLIDTLSVDTNRLYLTGLSMGGFGSMEYLRYYHVDQPDVLNFSAVAPMSGAGLGFGFSPQALGVMNDTPTWLFHGSNDPAVPSSDSRYSFQLLVSADSDPLPSPLPPIDFNETALGQPTAVVGDIRYTEIVGGGHAIWGPIYNNNEFYDWMFAQSLAEPAIPALVDIKPGSSPNSVNLKSKGVLPVAILSTDDFDVNEVDVDSLRFGDPLLIDNGGTAMSPLRSAYEDVSGDGLLDLTLKFSTADLVEYEALGSDTIEGLLTGELMNGTPFEGTDSIRIVPPNGSNGNGLQISTVPEPTTLLLATLASVVLLLRRRG